MKVFSLLEKLVEAGDSCYNVKNQLLGKQYQFLGEHVDFHIQVLMAVFGEGEYIADSGVFLSSHTVSLYSV